MSKKAILKNFTTSNLYFPCACFNGSKHIIHKMFPLPAVASFNTIKVMVTLSNVAGQPVFRLDNNLAIDI